MLHFFTYLKRGKNITRKLDCIGNNFFVVFVHYGNSFQPKTDPSLVISSKESNISNIAVKIEVGSTPAKT